MEASSCVELVPLCVANATCVFSSRSDCVARCGVAGGTEGKGGVKLGGCEATEGGCCPDGSPRVSDGKCCEFSENTNV